MVAQLLDLALGVHGVILPLSLVALSRYSDRSGSFSRAVGHADELLSSMRGSVAEALEKELNPVFERSEGEPNLVSLDLYSERPTNPLGSERYRQAIRRFMEGKAEQLVDYIRTHRAIRSWCNWARALSWVVLVLAFWQAVSLAVLGFLGKLLSLRIAESWILGSFAPTTLLIILFFYCQAAMLRQHDIIHEERTKYHEL